MTTRIDLSGSTLLITGVDGFTDATLIQHIFWEHKGICVSGFPNPLTKYVEVLRAFCCWEKMIST